MTIRLSSKQEFDHVINILHGLKPVNQSQEFDELKAKYEGLRSMRLVGSNSQNFTLDFKPYGEG